MTYPVSLFVICAIILVTTAPEKNKHFANIPTYNTAISRNANANPVAFIFADPSSLSLKFAGSRTKSTPALLSISAPILSTTGNPIGVGM